MIIKLTKRYTIDDNGNLYKNGKTVTYKRRFYLRVGKKVEQLAYWIGIYFVEGYKEGLVIDHIDSNPLNNNPSNLQWITQSENTKKRIYIHKPNPNDLSTKIREKFPYATKKDIMREINWYKRHNNVFRWEMK